MRRTFAFLLATLAVHMLFGCHSGHIQDESDSLGSVKQTETTDYFTAHPFVREIINIGFGDPQMITSNQMMPGAKDIWSTVAACGIAEPHENIVTDYEETRKLYPETVLETILLKVRVEEVASFSVNEFSRYYYSDGSEKAVSNRLGFTAVSTLVTGVIDVLGYDETGKFNPEDLIGKEIIIRFSPYWYIDNSGSLVKYNGHANADGRRRVYGYVPAERNEIIVQVSRNTRDGFRGVAAETIIEENKAALTKYRNLLKSNEAILEDDIFELQSLGTGESPGLINLVSVSNYYPAISIAGDEINNWSDFGDYLQSLNVYFQEKKELPAPWCYGYQGLSMPPEINDILKQISIGF
ncbi:MAG: hypothetical protein J5830_04720 [Clostridia bacterium]|nr:hypothetical protein [Clostridia bacterium]